MKKFDTRSMTRHFANEDYFSPTTIFNRYQNYLIEALITNKPHVAYQIYAPSKKIIY